MQLRAWLQGVIQTPNYLSVYEVLLRNGPLTRAEIADVTKLALPTVSRIVAEFSREGLVETVRELDSTGGRRPSLVGVAAERGYLVGLDWGASTLGGIVVDLKANVQVSHGINLTGTRPDGVLEAMESLVKTLLAQAGVESDQVLAVGVGVPGSVDRETNVLITASNVNISNWDVAGELSRRVNLPVYIENDTNAAGLGEALVGADAPQEHLAFVNVGTGIGMGIILHGRIFHGDLQQAGEIGHVVVLPDGPECTCGKQGCLEAMAGGWAIARAYRVQEVNVSGGRAEPGATDESPLSAKDVFRLARSGDVRAGRIVARAAKYLAVSLANLVNSLGIARIVLGGGVILHNEGFFTQVREHVFDGVLDEYRERIQVIRTPLGEQAGATGAAVLALQRVLGGLVREAQGEISTAADRL